MTTIRLILDAGSTPAISTILFFLTIYNTYVGECIMFTWKDLWKKPENPSQSPSLIDDQMEQALWDIKEIYDFETEEIDRVVSQKRTNLKKLKLRVKNK